MSNINIIRGITITPPLLGRITLGHTELRGSGENAKGVPKRDDHFSVTTLVQRDDRSWEPHAIQSTLVKGKEKLLRIPVKIAYNDMNLTLNNSYSAFDTKTGRVLCAGDGEQARRSTEDGVKQIACPRPEACEHAQRVRCKNMTRAYFQIDGQEDELGVFVLRSTSWNTLTSLAGRLARLHGLSGGLLAGMPLMLECKSKTTTQSYRKPIYYADLTFRPGYDLATTVKAARAHQQGMADAGLLMESMEAAIRSGVANGDFADEIEDADEWVSDDELIAKAGGQKPTSGIKSLDALMAAAGGSNGFSDVVSNSNDVAPPPAEAVTPTASPTDTTANAESSSVSPQSKSTVKPVLSKDVVAQF
jgi:hypothetical protein